MDEAAVDAVVPCAHPLIIVGCLEALAGSCYAVVEADDWIPREQIIFVLESVACLR